jgi:ATP-binding cassette subfamily B protein
VAWLTKLILDRLTSPSGSSPGLIGLAVGLAAIGVVFSVAPQAGQYLRAEVDRRVALRANDDLFAAVDRVAGVAGFEDPEFRDRLRLAQQSASSPRR